MRWASLVAGAVLFALVPAGSRGARAGETGSVVPIKAITDLEGAWRTRLQGRGVVVGLNGTGDKSKEIQREIAEICRKLNVTISPTDLNARKAAVVLLSADVPPFTRPGEAFDVRVSAIEAEDLTGGELVMSTLGVNEKDGKRTVYAFAQGKLSRATGATGKIIGGAVLEKELPTQIMDGDIFQLNLHEQDAEVAQSIATIINNTYETEEAGAVPVARVLSPKVVEVAVPPSERSRKFGFLGEVLNLPVDVEPKPLVVINEITGQVTITGSVRVSKAWITTDRLSIRVREVEDLGKLVKALNDAQVQGKELTSIIVQLKEAGAIHARVVTE